MKYELIYIWTTYSFDLRVKRADLFFTQMLSCTYILYIKIQILD